MQKKPKIYDDSKSTIVPNEYQHQTSREIFTKLFKLIRQNTSNGHVTKNSDTVLNTKDSKKMKYYTQNSNSNRKVKEDESSLYLYTIKNKIFKYFILFLFFVFLQHL